MTRPLSLVKLCPGKCSGGYAYNQRSLYEGELERIPADILHTVKGCLRYCAYCHAVLEDRGNYKRHFGRLEGDKFERDKRISG